jgi:hypothetical protein
MAITLETARANLDAWVTASAALAAGKEYRVGTRSLTRADANEVREMISYWQRVVDRLQGGGGGRWGRAVLRD